MTSHLSVGSAAPTDLEWVGTKSVTINSILKAFSQSRSTSISLVRLAFARSHKSKAMLSFTNPSTTYDGAERVARADHDLILIGYSCCVAGSPQARMKEIIGELWCPTKTGDDAYVTYGRGVALILHAAIPGDGLESVPFIGNSPKDTALARILEEAVATVSEETSGMTMPEWVKHCADMRQSTSLSARSRQALTLSVSDFFQHELWVPIHPAAGSGPLGGDLPATTFLRLWLREIVVESLMNSAGYPNYPEVHWQHYPRGLGPC